MSDEEKYAVIGRVVQEKQKAQRHLALLQSEASRLGKVLASTGYELQHKPESVVFERQSVNVMYAGGKPAYNPGDLDVEKLQRLADEIRETMDRLADMKRQATNLGIE